MEIPVGIVSTTFVHTSADNPIFRTSGNLTSPWRHVSFFLTHPLRDAALLLIQIIFFFQHAGPETMTSGTLKE